MKTFITILFSLLLVGCPNKEEDGFVSLSKGKLFGAGEEGFKKENIIISSNEDWNSFLKKADKTNKVSENFKDAIDFDKEMAIVIIDQVRNTGGFSIEVVEAKYDNGELIIKVYTKSPKATDMVTTAFEQPYHLIKIKKTMSPIKFVEL